MISPAPRFLPVATLLSLALATLPASAQWRTVTRQDGDASSARVFAYTVNDQGYKLEIYRDTVDAVRSRLSLAPGLIQFANKACPTYQVDRGTGRNRSMHEAPCIWNRSWSEFILGQVGSGRVESTALLALMDGVYVSYRFRLEDGDYRETRFTLQGSRSAITSAIGKDIAVQTSE